MILHDFAASAERSDDRLPVHKGVWLGVLYGVEAKIHVQIRPAKMVVVVQFNLQDLIDRRVPEPGEIGKRKKMLALVDMNPESEAIDIRDLNRGNGCATPW
jgi:hypothetical protein